MVTHCAETTISNVGIADTVRSSRTEKTLGVSKRATQFVNSKANPLSIRKKNRGAKASAYVSYAAIVALILSVVSVGYQSPVESQKAGRELSRAAIADTKPSVDQVAAAELAADAALTADMAIANNVNNLSISLSAKSDLAQSDDGTLSKPMIVQPSGGRGIRSYTALPGDTAPSVATKHGISTDTLKWANGLTSDAIPVGKVLQVPSVNGVVYTVQSGDTADSLAAKYKADKSRIITYNDAELTGLQPGQRIVIPDGILPANERPGAAGASRSSGSASYSAYYAASAAVAGNRYDYGYCTWYAYNRRAELGRPVGSFWGNATSWASYARASGYRVNHTPAPGAVLQSSNSYYGHVAVVESVNSDGSVTVSEMNYAGWNIISKRTISAGQAAGYNYIH